MSRAGLSAREWAATLLVILGCALLVRLGLWQLDRHEQRQAFKSRVESQLILPPLALDSTVPIHLLDGMEYRSVVVRGEYNFQDQIALANQAWENQPGVRLVTPLRIEGSPYSVLVDRGWIPLADTSPESWTKYDLPGVVEVSGIIRASTTRPEIGNKGDPPPAPGEADLKLWNLLNVGRIGQQVEGELVPIYVQESAGVLRASPPYPSAAEVELGDGPHLSYAAQWFLFAAILGIGYPMYLHRQRNGHQEKSVEYVRHSENV